MSTERLRCIIIDDEPLARQLIESHCLQMGNIEIVACCKTALEAFQVLHENTAVDLMFLDIQMPGITGLSFLKSLKDPPKAIFTTAYTDHAVEAFELEALDYLVKPITFERFFKAVQRASVKPGASTIATALPVAPLPSGPDAIFLKVNRRLLRIELQEIQYMESLGDYVKVFTDNGLQVCYTTLNKLEELLPEQLFLRVHRSYMIPLKRINFLEGNFVKIGDTDVPIGQTYKEALMKRLNYKEE